MVDVLKPGYIFQNLSINKNKLIELKVISFIIILSMFLSSLLIFTGFQQYKNHSKEFKPIGDKLVYAWNEKNSDKLNRTCDQGFLRTLSQKPGSAGVEVYKNVIIALRTNYHDLVLPVDIETFSGNSIALCGFLTETNTGPFNIPAAGKSLKIFRGTIIPPADGKINKEMAAHDSLRLKNTWLYDRASI